MVDPERDISPAAFAVNKIAQEELSGAPKIKEVLPKFFDFIQGSCLCSYNAPFDLEFLASESRQAGVGLPPEMVVVDILTMAKRLLPHLERYALWFIADTLGIRVTQKHRALQDVELTLGVFYKLKEILYSKGIDEFPQFLSLFGLTSGFLDSINNQKIAQIQEALSLGVKLKIKYFSGANAAVSEREVIPKEIKQVKTRSYLVGYCCLRQEERTFRIDGILHLEII